MVVNAFTFASQRAERDISLEDSLCVTALILASGDSLGIQINREKKNL